MPNIKSAIKRVKIIQNRTLRNSMIKSALKTYIKRFDEALTSKDSEKIKNSFVKATQHIDKAVSKGVLHKNTANRKKSLLSKKLNAVQ